MNIKFLALVAGTALLTAGCISTVSGNKAGAVPLMNDRVQGRYERSVAQVYDAAKAVLAFNGAITAESNLTATNVVRALEGKVNNRSVWIRVEQIDPKLTAVTVQARNKWGTTEPELVHELEKEIALKLAQ